VDALLLDDLLWNYLEPSGITAGFFSNINNSCTKEEPMLEHNDELISSKTESTTT